MIDPFDNWRAAVAGESPPMHEDEPWCGYFKIRDRRGLNAGKTAIKRPFIACAIWPDANGNLTGELAGTPVEAERLWPYCAKYPITYEDYAYWHQHECWPEKENVS